MQTPPFSTLGLPEDLLRSVEALGFERPSPIQALAIPPALAGQDILGLSATGSGKTAAFSIPLLANIDLSSGNTQAIVLCPTRELANQVCEEIHRIASKLDNFRAIPVYGGAPIERQLRSLQQGAQVVVGTPGRVLDHLRRRSLKLNHIETIVLDEADRMLDMGFREEMEELLEAMPAERQTLFFSATMNRQVTRFIDNFGNDPQKIEVKQEAKTVDSIEQVCFEVRQRSKVEVVSRLLDMEPTRLSIIFCNTKRSVDECAEALLARGYSVDRLHGDITQSMRERVLRRFRESTVEVLVATDVAARGLDVEEIDLVINYDLPQDPEDYVHRIGRTGRAGRSGKAVSLIFGRDLHRMEMIERYTRHPVQRQRVPSQEQVEGKVADRQFEEIKQRLEAGDFTSYSEQLDRLLEQGHTPTDVASTLLTLLKEQSGREFNPIQEDNEELRERRPRKQKERKSNRDNPRKQGDRFEKPDREHGSNRDGSNMYVDEGMVALFFSLGKQNDLRVGELLGLCYNESSIPQGSIGHVRLFPKSTRIEVKQEQAAALIAALKGKKLRGKNFILDYDRSPQGKKQNGA